MPMFPCKRPESMTNYDVDILCNLFPIKTKPMLHSYLVSFTPELKRDLHQLFMRVAGDSLKDVKFAFDGINNLITLKKIEDYQLEFDLGTKKFILKVVYKNSSTEEELAIAMYETVIKHYQQIKFFTEGKRSFNKAEVCRLTGGVELHSGLVHSIKSTRLGMFVNLDSCFGVFIQEKEVIDLLEGLFRDKNKRGGNNLPPLNDSFWSEVNVILKNCQVETLHTQYPKKFKLSGIILKSANEVLFEKDDKEISVAEYFSQTYSKLRYPNYPLALVKKRGKESYFPLETLRICENQKYSRKLDDVQTAEMIKFAAKVPTDRFSFISERVKDLELFDNPVLKDFNFQINNSFQKCKGRVIKAPSISFGKNKTVMPKDGGFSLIDTYCSLEAKISKMLVVSLASVDKSEVVRSIGHLIDFGRKYGVHLPSNYLATPVDSPKDFENLLKKENPNLVIVILTDKRAKIYNQIKRIAESKAGVITQCIQSRNISKLDKPSFAYNLLLKINVKLGGINVTINKSLNSNFVNDTIIMAADVSHPGIGDLDSPSIVGMVSSTDSSFSHYNTYISQQQRRTEIIQDLSNLVKKSLIKYIEINKKEPSKIIFFRDGVGDSQLESVLKTEYTAIKEGCNSFKPNYNPELNLIVVQKRHSVRFLLSEGSGGLRGGSRDIIDSVENMNLTRSNNLKGGYQGGQGGRGQGGYQGRDGGRDNYQGRGGPGGYQGRGDNYQGRAGQGGQGGYQGRGQGGYQGRGGPGGRDSSSKGNVVPGTVVEDIGHPLCYDFYMVSHFALQGTARPIRYQILTNESKFKNEELQDFIHHLSYLYQRANKAISGPAPVRFAHLAALRARAYFERENDVLEYLPPFEELMEYLYYL